MSFWCCNPYLNMFRRPMFWVYPRRNSGVSSTTGAYRAKTAAFTSTAALYPYCFFSNWGNGVQVNALDPTLPMDTVMHIQNLQTNPYYVIRSNPIDTIAQEQAIAQAEARGSARADKIILKTNFTIAARHTVKFLAEIDALLKTKGLSDENKAKIEALRAKVAALQQKLEAYKTQSANKPVNEALVEVNAMLDEITALEQEGKTLAQAIASSMQQNPTDPQDPNDPADPANPTDPADPADPADPPRNDVVVPPPPGSNQGPDEVEDPDAVENPMFDNDGKIKLDNENLTVDDVRNAYNAYRPQLNEFLKTEGLSAADKKAIIDKSKALVDAMKAENAQPKDVAKLYNELIDLVKRAAENINKANNNTDVKKINEAYSKELRPKLNYIINDPDISAEDKKAILDKSNLLVAAINANKPVEEVAKLYDELIEIYKKAVANTDKTRKTNAAQICSDLYSGANGTDWSWCGEGDGEKKIKDAVNKITKYNVIEVLKQWEDGGYNDKTGDTCIIDTIKHEFNWSTDNAKSLINKILDCLKEAAKEKGLLEAITPAIATITGEMDCTWWDEEKMYNAFKEILAIFGIIKLPGEQNKTT